MAQEKYLGENGLRRLSELIKEDLSGKANLDGSYDSLQAGSAKQLVSPTGVTDTAPYIFRTTAGSANVSDGLAELKSIRGKTIVWNQLAVLTRTTQTIRGITYTNNGDNTLSISGTSEGIETTIIGTFKLTEGHKYLARSNFIKGSPSAETYWVKWATVGYGKDVGNGLLFTATSSNDTAYIIFTTEGAGIAVDCKASFNIFDLTLMFGAGNEPTSVLEFIRDYSKTFYGFDAGSIKNVQLDGGLKTVGYNAFDGELEKGAIYPDGENNANTNVIRAKNWIQVIPGQTYTAEISDDAWNGNVFFYGRNVKNDVSTGRLIINSTSKVSTLVIPNDIHFIRFSLPNKTSVPSSNQCAFHLTHSGSRTGFEPHEEHVLHIDTARYFPEGMNGVGTTYDELTPKRAIKRMGKVDMGTLNWVKMPNGRMASESLKDIIKLHKKYEGIPSLVCSKYSVDTPYNLEHTPKDKTISMGGNGYAIAVYDSDYTDPTAFKQAMSGVYLYYELATPEITEIPQTRDINWAIQVSDYGTEEFLIAEGHEVPVPHETLYMDNLVDKLRNLPDPSEYQEVVDKVNAPKLLSDIVDADGNPRFQYVPLELGVWFTEANVQNGFAFYSINGYSMRIVAGGVIPSGTTLPTSGRNFINEFKIPKWLADKIFFMDGSQWGESQDIFPLIVPKATRKPDTTGVYTSQIDIGGYLSLKGRYRSSDNAYLVTSSIGGISLTTAFDSYFRFEWNLIIN